MKKSAACLIVWMIITLILTLSIVGMLLFIGNTIHYTHGSPDIHKSTWMEMGSRLLEDYLRK